MNQFRRLTDELTNCIFADLHTGKSRFAHMIDADLHIAKANHQNKADLVVNEVKLSYIGEHGLVSL